MSHIDDGKLNALLDGELEAEAAAAVQAHIAGCPECAGRLEEARRFLSQATDLLGALDLPAEAARHQASPSLASRPRRVSSTAKEAAIDLDGATQQSPAIGAGAHAPEPLLRRPRPAPAERRFDYSSLAWAATIILAIGVGYLGNEVQHARRERQAVGNREPGLAGASAAQPAGVDSAATQGAPAAEVGKTAPLATRLGSAATRTVRRDAGGPPAAKAPPGEGMPAIAGRTATGLGHKRLDRGAQNVAGVRAAPERNDQLAGALAAPTAGAGGAAPAAPSPAPAEARAAAPAAAADAPVARRVARPAAEGSAESVLVVVPHGAPLDNAAPAAAGFRVVPLEDAVGRLRGAIRLVDGMRIERVQVGPGRLVAGADSGRDVVRVSYLEGGQPVVLDQQRLDPPAQAEDGNAAAPTRFAGLAVGDTLLTVAPDGQRRARWLDGLGFWLSLSGRLPADSLRQLVERVR